MNAQRPTPNAQRPSTAKGAQKYDLEDRLLDYAVMILKVVQQLPSTRVANHIAGQLVRCGTSPLPNHGEAEAAESSDDFAHKLKVCLKELRESRRWMLLIERAELLGNKQLVSGTLQETEELIRIFFASLKTVERHKRDRQARRGG